MISKLPSLPFVDLQKGSKKRAQQFAEQSGIVYFGYVSQRNDDHHIVRGITVGTKHVDDHYCIGSYSGYDIAYVQRVDTVARGKRHGWDIIELDLHDRHIPHCFILDSSSTELLDQVRLKYPVMKPTEAVTSERAHRLYAVPTHHHELEHLLQNGIDKIKLHFASLSLELQGSSLYIYVDSARATPRVLQTALDNAVWLAESLELKNRQS